MKWICDDCATREHGSNCGNCGGKRENVERKR
jgi:hypothetical protein